jgi:hypothetical protein
MKPSKQEKATHKYPDPEPVRRKLAAAFRESATDPRHTPAERAEFARMAAAWERTLKVKTSRKRPSRK